MNVSEIGEFGLIDLLSKMISDSETPQHGPHPPVIGIGDDAAAWQGDPAIQLATVDTMVQNIHFSLETTPWKELGWKSISINLSDIAAMGGKPDFALVALALPETVQVEDVTLLYQGMMEAARLFNLSIIGGNLSRSPVVSVTITVIGSSPEGKILRRSTALPGDMIAVTGYPGSAAAGPEMLTQNRSFEPDTAAYLRNAFLHPMPRIVEGNILVKHDITTAIDTSDGLLADLRHICEASHVSARVNTSLVPIHESVREFYGERATEVALSEGEDYELLFTGTDEKFDKIRSLMSCPVTIIGDIMGGEPGKIDLVDAEGNSIEINRTGWEHF